MTAAAGYAARSTPISAARAYPPSPYAAHQTVKTTITLDAPDRQEYVIEKIKDASPEALKCRAAWLK